MKNAEQLREELAAVFGALKAGHIKPSVAGELANVAGKIISSAKVQVEYFALRKEAPDIPFLSR